MAKVSEVLKNVYFPNKNNGIYIECGANNGTSGSELYELELIGWQAINIEAQNSYYAQLLVHRPKAINLNYALCDQDDCNLTLIVTSQPDNSSLQHSEKHRQELIQLRHSTFSEQSVKAISWKRLIEQQKLDHVDALGLHIEGCEKFVLQNMIDCPVIPDVICIEVGYEWGPKKELLKQLGYRFDFFYYNNAYCSKPHIVVDPTQVAKYRQNRFDWWDVTIYDAAKDSF